MRWLLILLTAAFFATVQSQTWIGTYIANSNCSLSACCCLINSINVTRPSNNTLAFSTMLAGAYCSDLTSYSASTTYPNSYSFSIAVLIISLNITLSNDSNNIMITSSLGASCDVLASRNTAVQTSTVQSTTTQAHSGSSKSLWQYTDILMLFNMVSFGIMMIN
jgi:hypothetical protein